MSDGSMFNIASCCSSFVIINLQFSSLTPSGTFPDIIKESFSSKRLHRLSDPREPLFYLIGSAPPFLIG